MISRTFRLAIAAVLVAVACATAKAEDTAAKPADYTGNSVYVAIGGTYGIENQKTFDGSVGNSGGYDLRVGYSFMKMFGAEVEWESWGQFDRDILDPITNQQEPSLEARMLSLNGKISPLTGRFQPYASLGMGWFNVQADKISDSVHESAFAMRFGLGVVGYITNRLGVLAEAGYVIPMTGTLGGGDRFDLVPLTFSFFFRFK